MSEPTKGAGDACGAGCPYSIVDESSEEFSALLP